MTTSELYNLLGIGVAILVAIGVLIIGYKKGYLRRDA